jgi:zinc transport system substrate-binding protein
MRRHRALPFAGAPLLMLAALAAAPTSSAQDKPVVYTTFYPTEYFTQRIGGDLVEVENPVPADADPIFWQPSREDLQAYQEADLVVVNGAGFEKWVEQATLPEDRVVDTAAPFANQLITYEDAITHSHGSVGEHSHEGLDGHTWLDPHHAKVQAAEIKDALAERLPAHAATFEHNYQDLAADLDALDEELSDYRESYGNQPFFASRPAYNYLARRYGWNVDNLDLDPEEMPDEETFAEIEARMAEHPAEYIVWEGEPTPEIAERFEQELGLKSVTFSPVEQLGEEERASGLDYLEVMRDNLEAIRPIFKAKSS